MDLTNRGLNAYAQRREARASSCSSCDLDHGVEKRDEYREWVDNLRDIARRARCRRESVLRDCLCSRFAKALGVRLHAQAA